MDNAEEFWKSKRILVVDDFEMVRNLVKKALRDLKCEHISEAENGAIALKMMMTAAEAGEPFDLVMSDWGMPILNGMDFFKKIKTTELIKKTPFIMFMAESDSQSVMKAVNEGIKHFMIKPVLKPKLVAKLQEVRADLELEEKKRKFGV